MDTQLASRDLRHSVTVAVAATHLEHSWSSSDGQAVGAGGIGLRYELARKFGLHAGLDLAHSPGTTAVYIQIGNAWFRP
jgi:hypothetical protein